MHSIVLQFHSVVAVCAFHRCGVCVSVLRTVRFYNITCTYDLVEKRLPTLEWHIFIQIPQTNVLYILSTYSWETKSEENGKIVSFVYTYIYKENRIAFGFAFWFVC